MELLDKILKEYQANGIESEQLIELLAQKREEFLAQEDPLATKVTRLCKEYIIENGEFDVQIEENEDSDVDSFEYLMNLLLDPQNKYNREEIAEYRTILKRKLY